MQLGPDLVPKWQICAMLRNDSPVLRRPHRLREWKLDLPSFKSFDHIDLCLVSFIRRRILI